jgi:drebrin-like protein
MQKVADASGSKYSGATAPTTAPGPKPPVASKPAFTPTQSTSGFKPLGGARAPIQRDENVDEDGWGQDAPPVYRTQLEKVAPAYQPTKVNMAELTSQKPVQSQYSSSRDESQREDVVKGGYQPVGKVDIAALRREAQESGNNVDNRPTTVKGAYEPVGKVDIAAIRAKAQPPTYGRSPPSSISPAATGGSVEDDRPRSLVDRSATFTASERLTSLPKPKVSNKFGGGTTFTGTKAPTPGGFEARSTPVAAPVGTASRTFADQGGKTPAQIWAEKKAQERGLSGSKEAPPPAMGYGGPASPITSQTSGGGEWKSGYTGKSWAPVQTTHTGKSASSLGEQKTGPQEETQVETPASPVGGISSIRDRFKETAPMGAPATNFERSAPEPPPLDTYSKPNAGRGIPIPGFQPQAQHENEETEPPSMPTPLPQPRSPTPPTPEMRPSSPIRVAMPISRGAAPDVTDAHEEQLSPPPAMPSKSIEEAIPHDRDLPDDSHDAGRGAAVATAAATFGARAAAAGASAGASGTQGKRAIVQYDYEKAEDNEIELKEGEYVTNIDMVDDDWWMGENARGETGLFPSNYVELVEDGAAPAAAASPLVEEHSAPAGSSAVKAGPTATAQYDYEAAEDNEISFPEGAKITNLVSPTISMPIISRC